MNFQITPVIFGARPIVSKPNHAFLEAIGEEGMRTLIDKHYESIRDSSIYSIFPQNEKEYEQAKVNASDFFIQICGGIAHFNTNRGAPMMIKRHIPFAITQEARNTWLELYMPLLNELEEQGIDKELIRSFWNYLDIFSAWMMNTK